MKKNFYAILLGLLFCVFLYGVAEVFFRLNAHFSWIEKPQDHPPESFYHFNNSKSAQLAQMMAAEKISEWQPRISYDEEERLREEGIDRSQIGPLPMNPGLSPFPISQSFRSRIFTKKTRTLVYDNQFTTDSTGRRVTPVREQPRYNIVTMGDSYTLGEGVADQESFPYQLGLLRPEAQVYNLGAAGNGPNDVLFELNMNSRRLLDIPKRKTIVFYTFMDNHFERLFCRSLCVYPEDWIFAKPYYDWQDGAVHLVGRFNRDRLFLDILYAFVAHSAVTGFFRVVLPPRFTAEHVDFFLEVVQQISRETKKIFPDSEFFLSFFPGTSGVFEPVLAPGAASRGIATLEYKDLDVKSITRHRDYLPVDWHPSPVSQFLYAKLLHRDLPEP